MTARCRWSTTLGPRSTSSNRAMLLSLGPMPLPSGSVVLVAFESV
jgi:hypothetical protein